MARRIVNNKVSGYYANSEQYETPIVNPWIRTFTEAMNCESEVDECTINNIRRALDPNKTVKPSAHKNRSEPNADECDYDVITQHIDETPVTPESFEISMEPCKIDPEVRIDRIFSQSDVNWNAPQELGPSSGDTQIVGELNRVFSNQKGCINLKRSCCDILNKYYGQFK